MKFVYCTCNLSKKEEVIKTLENAGILDYQIIDEVPAKPMLGSPRLNTAVWPGYNCIILMQFSDDKAADNIMIRLKTMNAEAENKAELITACSLPMDDYFYE
ncbi:MAG TPA: hypothetical protein VJ946_03285 [Bacteroidales bacterium]|nr:hypothetical protein [Bacteroidales bacterium]